MSDPRKKSASLPIWKRWSIFLLGVLICGWSFNALFVNNELITGGLPGLALLLFRLFDWDPALTQLIGGLLLLGLTGLFLGWNGLLRTLIGSLALPLAIALFSGVPTLTENLILAAGFGGFLLGCGLGLIFYSGFTVGGFSALARILAEKFHLPLARCILIMDALIVISAGTFFGAEASMFALLAVISLGKAIDLVQTGLTQAKAAMIITEHPEEIRQTLLETLDCGATLVHAEGAHSGQPRTLVISVVPRNKIARLRRHIHHTDPKAFPLITQASEVLGYGFRSM